jgi:hypothetical protein
MFGYAKSHHRRYLYADLCCSFKTVEVAREKMGNYLSDNYHTRNQDYLSRSQTVVSMTGYSWVMRVWIL